MMRIAKLFVLGLAFAACRTPQFAVVEPSVPVPAECEALKAQETEYLHCLVRVQQSQILTLQQRPRAVTPSAGPVGMWTMMPIQELPFVPNGHQLLAISGRVLSDTTGIAVFRTDDTPVGMGGYVCAKRGGAFIPIQGNGAVSVLVDMDKSGAAEPVAYRCMPTTANDVRFPGVDVGEKVTLVFVKKAPSAMIVVAGQSLPAWRPAYCTDFYRNTDYDGGWAKYYSSTGGWNCGS